jgi:regulator of sigma E protease
LALEVKRGEQVLKVEVIPQRMEVPDIFGKKVSTVIIGITTSEDMAVDQVGPFLAFEKGVTHSLRIAWATLDIIYKLLAREAPLKTLGGPIFIAQIAGKQAEAGASHLIFFMAALSINLTMLNLLPIPILDGGHLFFFAWEAVRGKPVAIKHREMAQAVGLMLILGLMALVFYQDILRLLSPKP